MHQKPHILVERMLFGDFRVAVWDEHLQPLLDRGYFCRGLDSALLTAQAVRKDLYPTYEIKFSEFTFQQHKLMTTYKYGQKLPKKLEKKLDAYIERIKAIKWFTPNPEFKEEDARVLAGKVLSSFGVVAEVKFRDLKTTEDLDAAWGAARDAAWDAAWDAARDAAWGAAWDAAGGAAWDAAGDAAWGAAWNAAWGACDELANEVEIYKLKYPDGNFKNLIPLYEMGLYPVGVIDGEFIIYVPKPL